MERGYEHRLSNRCLSPLRYPGGKAKITQFIANVLDTNKITGTYIEPFAGGAGVALNLLYAGKVNSIIINDLDDGVYSFWKTATNEPGYLTNKIKKVPFSYGESNNPEVLSSYWQAIKKRYETNRYRDTRLKAFDFLMLNRMNVSGIINAGPIGGITQENSYDISARFNKQTLIERLELLYAYSDKIRVTSFEASHFLDLLSQGYFNTTSNSLVYLDPPYFNQGKKLYSCFAPYIIHSQIADKLLKA
ncbi:MAG: DNA adenine methylase, partial [Varibaculum cambriense]|nr:DNA adenine methylase [Varibaculum cambriense]